MSSWAASVAEWEATTLGALCERNGGFVQTGPFGSQLHAEDYVEDGVPVVMPQQLGDNTVIEDGIARITEADARRLSKHRLRAGDIVYSRRGDVERRSLVRPPQDGWVCGTGCLLVRLGDAAEVDSAFVSYRLGAPDAREWIVNHAVGATMPNLNTSILSALPLTLPSYAEQRAIAEVLGALDDKIAANSRLATTADELAGTLFRRAVADADFGTATFDDVAEVGGGGTPSTKVADYWDGEIPWASPTDITRLGGLPYLFDTARGITAMGLANCSSKLYPAGSILMTSRATIGAFALAQVPTAANQGFIVVIPPDETLRYWLFHEMRDRVDEFLTHANGATFLELSRGTFRRLQVRQASRAVMEAFSTRARDLHAAAAGTLKENTALAATRDALLPALMSGTLRVRDAERLAETLT